MRNLHRLIQEVASDTTRHLILVTATPHSGNEGAFRSLLAMLDPKFSDLPEDLSGDENRSHRHQLARHLVQRRRGDIRSYLASTISFPDRQEREETYRLSKPYAALFERVLAYARETVADNSGAAHHQRVRWWSALALLPVVGVQPRGGRRDPAHALGTV